MSTPALARINTGFYAVALAGEHVGTVAHGGAWAPGWHWIPARGRKWRGPYRTRREAVAALVEACQLAADRRNLRDAGAEVSAARALRQGLERKYGRKP